MIAGYCIVNWLFVSSMYRLDDDVCHRGSGDHTVPEGQKVDDNRSCAEGRKDTVGMCRDCSVYCTNII